MKRIKLLLWALLLTGSLSGPNALNARGRHSNVGSTSYQSTSNSSSERKSIHVRSYTRKDGTRVEGYERSAPKTATPRATTHENTYHYATPTLTAPVSAPIKHESTYAVGVERDKKGKIKRSERAKDDFKRAHPCPATGRGAGACPGYIIDHIKALKRGGSDTPDNMQWQTKEAALAKDRVE